MNIYAGEPNKTLFLDSERSEECIYDELKLLRFVDSKVLRVFYYYSPFESLIIIKNSVFNN